MTFRIVSRIHKPRVCADDTSIMYASNDIEEMNVALKGKVHGSAHAR